jgi:L1 cell adhesion molecule like protein
MSNTSEIAIGIDLGTTYSCVAVMINGNVEIIANDMGNRTTPSYVAFTDVERLIGEAAKNQASYNPENTIFDAKRLIGRKYNDDIVQENLRHFPFTIINGKNNNPEIKVKYKDEEKTFAPEEISAAVLNKMKLIAEAYLGHPVKKAVITVPAYFNNSQRQSTQNAGIIAGLEVLRIINEPTAAAIAYKLQKPSEKDKKVLIFDLGGGTFDVSILSIDTSGLIEVKGTSGNTHLGGEDFDNIIVDYFVEEFAKKYDIDISKNIKALRRLRIQSEIAKRTLSNSTVVDINIDSIVDGIDFSTRLTKANFERLCDSKFKECILTIKDALKSSKLNKSEIDEIVLVGGSTRIPKIRQLVKEYFNGKEPICTMNPDEAIAYGAAVQAAILTGHDESGITDGITLVNAVSISCGVAEGKGILVNGKLDQKFQIILERGKPIPIKKKELFSTGIDNQTNIKIDIYEGERPTILGNNHLGTFTLLDIPPMPRNVPQIEIEFDMDENGILNVKATEKSSKKSKNITITNSNKMTLQDILKMCEDANKFAEDDKKIAELIESKNKLENFIYCWKSTINDESINDKFSIQEIKIFSDILLESENWIYKNDSEKIEFDKKIYDDKLLELEKIIIPIIKKIHDINDIDNFKVIEGND